MVRWSFVFGILGATIGLLAEGALAQSVIVPDETLGVERSNVIENFNGAPIEAIEQGARRGQNLFHSFLQFNVDAGRSAYFFVPDNAVRNVLTRITGSNPSDILGRLGTFQVVNNQFVPSSANFFLVNPNGVIFGPNSSLDIGGSVVVTTANALQFPNGELFSASVPTIPRQLLTVDPSALLYNAIATQNVGIVVRSQINDPNNLIGTTNGLQVRDGRSLLLIGGNLNIEGGRLNAPGGRVELGGLAGAGSVELVMENNDLQLIFPAGRVALADVSLTNASKVDTSGTRGKGIVINAQNINILNGSSVGTGINQGLGSIDSTAGDININATGTVTVADSSFIASILLGVGNGGNINIGGQDVSIINGSQASSVSLGQGDAGDVSIQAKGAISFSGRDVNNGVGGILTGVVSGTTIGVPAISGTGNGGDIKLEARSISLSDGVGLLTNSLLAPGRSGNINIIVRDSLSTQNGSLISTSTQGQGDAGSILIQAGNRVSFEGINPNGLRGGVSSRVLPVQNVNVTNPRKGGDIQIETGILDITNGAAVDSSTSGQGNAGKVIVQAVETISLENTSFILSNVEAGGVGNAGSIDITGNSIDLKGGSQIQSTLRDADLQNSLPGGRGRAGNVKIRTNGNITISGRDSGGQFSSAILSSARSGTQGDSGNIDMTAGNIVLDEDGSIFSNTFGPGSGGNIMITSGNLTLNSGGQISGGSGRENVPGEFGRGGNISIKVNDSLTIDSNGGIINRSGIFTETSSPSYAGDIDVTTRQLLIRNGGAIASGGSGSGSLGGDGGNLTVNASESIELVGSEKLKDGSSGRASVLTTEASGIGNAGKLTITTGELNLRNGGSVVAATFGKGNAGSIDITAQKISASDASLITSRIGAGAIGDGGDIVIQTNSANLKTGSQISSFVTRQQQDSDGNIILGGQGNAGKILITAIDSITLSGANSDGFSAGIIATTERGASGFAGDIKINTGNLKIEDGAVIVASTYNPSQGGNISINTKNLELLNGGQVVTSTRGSGNAGIIQIDATDNAIISGRDVDFNNRIDRTREYLRNPDISNQFENIDGIILNEGAESGLFTSTRINASGSGGDIILSTNNIDLTDGGFISAQSAGIGNAGDILMDIRNRLEANNGTISTSAAQSSGGNIFINTKEGFSKGIVILRRDSDITTNSRGDGGNITIGGAAVVALGDSDIISRSLEANGGNITLTNFFSQTLPPGSAENFDLNGQVDLNASGQVSAGIVTTNDTSFIQNSLNQLPNNQIDTNKLLAQTCLIRQDQPEGTFYITGTGGIPNRPNDPALSDYPTNTIQPTTQIAQKPWKLGDPIVEPQGFYKLTNGRLVMSRECNP